MTRNIPLRGMSLSGGLQNFMHGHDILSSTMDEAQFHTYRRECDICILICRISHYINLYIDTLCKIDQCFDTYP